VSAVPGLPTNWTMPLIPAVTGSRAGSMIDLLCAARLYDAEWQGERGEADRQGKRLTPVR
jgi:hypothetical protein